MTDATAQSNILVEREAALLLREKELEAQVAACNERHAILERKEEEMKSVAVIAQGQRAEDLLKLLDDTFSCSL